jgi:hypothetical protein
LDLDIFCNAFCNDLGTVEGYTVYKGTCYIGFVRTIQGLGAAMAEKQPDYLAYQLRLWRAGGGGRVVWRTSLKSAQTRERKNFANLDDLFDFLRQQTRVSSDADRDEGETRE